MTKAKEGEKTIHCTYIALCFVEDNLRQKRKTWSSVENIAIIRALNPGRPFQWIPWSIQRVLCFQLLVSGHCQILQSSFNINQERSQGREAWINGRGSWQRDWVVGGLVREEFDGFHYRTESQDSLFGEERKDLKGHKSSVRKNKQKRILKGKANGLERVKTYMLAQ